MKLQISFREPGKGFYRMILSVGEILRFTRGKARRIPPKKDSITNSVHIKYITSIKLVDTKQSTCSVCRKEDIPVICYTCVENMIKTAPPGPQERP